jgi:hypothetical protein
MPVFPLCLQDSKWPLAGEDFQRQCPSKQQAFPLSGPLLTSASSCACSDPVFALVRVSLRRSSTLCSPCHGITSGLRQPYGGNASSSRSPNLALSCRFAPARCLTIRAGPNASSGTAVAFSQPRQQARRRRLPWRFAPAPPLPLVNTVNTHALDLYHLALSRRHGPPSLILFPHPFWPCLVAALHLAVHTLHRLLSPTRHRLALLSRAFSFVRDDSLLTSTTHSLDSNTTIWTLYLSSLPTWVFGPGPNLEELPASIPRCGRDHQCGVDPFHDILGIGCEN